MPIVKPLTAQMEQKDINKRGNQVLADSFYGLCGVRCAGDDVREEEGIETRKFV